LTDKYVEKLKSVLSSIEDYIYSKLSASPIVRKSTPEIEEEIADKIASIITKYKLEAPASLLLEVIKPFNLIVSNLIILPSSPLLYLFGLDGYRYVDFFEKRSNVELLLKKLKRKP